MNVEAYKRALLASLFVLGVVGCGADENNATDTPDAGMMVAAQDMPAAADDMKPSTEEDMAPAVEEDMPSELEPDGVVEVDMAPPLPMTALQEYIAKDDGAFEYEVITHQSVANFEAYKLRVTSQKWRTEEEVDRTLWEHDVFVLVPPGMSSTTALLIVAGGSNRDEEPSTDLPDELLIYMDIARSIGAPIIELKQIPNQPLKFADRDAPAKEDELVAYTWRKVIDEQDPTWAAYFPMAKSVIKTMDAVQEHSANAAGGEFTVDDFIITGFSKRGATTFLAGATGDPRIKAIAPGVFDVLKLDQQIEHHWSAYGFYAEAVGDYLNEGVMQKAGTPEGDYMQQFVDPFSYVDYLKMPKFLMMATGDQFFLPDSARFYYHDLEGPTAMRMYANTGHSMSERIEDAVGNLSDWIVSVQDGEPMPEIRWERAGDMVEVTASPAPVSASVWTVTNPDSRDFRHEQIGENWVEADKELEADGSVMLELVAPEAGFTGYLVDLTFESGLVFSTHVFMAPDTLPFEGTRPTE